MKIPKRYDASKTFEPVSKLPSLTVPDETLSVRQILEKHMRGQKIKEQLYRTPVFNDTEDFDSPDMEKVKTMDLTEKEELKNNLSYQISELESKKSEIEARRKQKKQAPDKPKDDKGTAKDDGKPEPKTAADEPSTDSATLT